MKRSVTAERAHAVGLLICGTEGRVLVESVASALGTSPYRVLQATEYWNERDCDPRKGWGGRRLVVEGEGEWLRRQSKDEVRITYDLARQLDKWGTDADSDAPETD